MMKCGIGRFCILFLLLCVMANALAQPHGKKRPPFNPAKFEADLEQFIATNAFLTPQEAAKFFPVYRQMLKKQRVLFDEARRTRQINPKDNEACAEAIRKQDELDLQIKLLQQEYHARFMTLLSPSKVVDVIKAEEKFHRQMFKRMK